MDIQESLKLNMTRRPQSYKKRLIAQPLNGSSTITIGSSASTQTRIEVPSCCNYIGDLEIGYQMSLSAPVRTNNMVYLPSHYLPEIQRIEIFLADATNKLVDITNAHIYSRMTSSLFNNFRNRSVSERINFKKEAGNNIIARNSNPIIPTQNPYMVNSNGIQEIAGNTSAVATSRTGTAVGTFSLAAQTTFLVFYTAGINYAKYGYVTISATNPATIVSGLSQGESAFIMGGGPLYELRAGAGGTVTIDPIWANNTTVNLPIRTLTFEGNNFVQVPSQSQANGTYITNLSISDQNTSDAYFNDAISRSSGFQIIPPNPENQQEYLPMGYFEPDNLNQNEINLIPIQYNFNFKLKDFLHDSVLSNLKCLYHRSNFVIVIYWQPVSQILFQVPTNITCNNGNIIAPPTKSGPPTSYSLAPTLNISNLFVRYYAEMNPAICEEIKNSSYEIAYPFLYQANLNLSPGVGGQLGVNLIVGNEGESRIYRVYCGLQGVVSTGNSNFLPSDNFTNIQYKKWNGNVELYFNNDLYQRITSAYGDWDATMMPVFKDGSLNTSVELQNLGVIAFHFDSSENNGTAKEYDDNVLKGKFCNEFININPRWLTVQNDGGTNLLCNYTGYVFAVIMRKGIVKNGEFMVA